MKWGVSHREAALTVPDNSVAATRDAVERLRTDDALRVALAEQSRGGDRDFDPVAIRCQFVEVLRNAAQSRPHGSAADR